MFRCHRTETDNLSPTLCPSRHEEDENSIVATAGPPRIISHMHRLCTPDLHQWQSTVREAAHDRVHAANMRRLMLHPGGGSRYNHVRAIQASAPRQIASGRACR